MRSYSVRYGFSQAFEVEPSTAYEWCTDFREDDWARMGKKGTRRIQRINDDGLILTDSVGTGKRRVTKRRLVRLNPDRLAWTNTHLSGPNRFSQFWYEIVSDGKGGSSLEFTGLQVKYGSRPSSARIAEMAKELATEDSGDWLLLANEMHRDLKQK